MGWAICGAGWMGSSLGATVTTPLSSWGVFTTHPDTDLRLHTFIPHGVLDFLISLSA